MSDITMPRLSDQMEQGTIVSWLVADGQPVAVGDELVEIETDKATMSVPSEQEGVLRIVVGVGETVAVGEVIARVGGDADAQAAEAEPAVAEPAEAEPAEAEPAAAEPVAAGVAPAAVDGRPVATPLARRVARAHGVDVAAVGGTGPGGRVTKDDVLRAAGIAPEPDPDVATAPAPRSAAPPAAPAPVPDGARIQQPTRLQQIVATRMAEQALVPVFQVQADVEMDAALALRAELKALAGDGPAPSVNDLIVRACALALRDHPLVNGSYRDGAFVLHDHVNVGIAVATDDGLLVVTIPDADAKSLGQIAAESRELAARARAGRATPADLTGATFTVSNLGMFGMTQITAVVNPPQAAIVGVGSARAVLARGADGEIVERTLVALNLSCDHRILNGADGARFLADVKRLLETPLRLAL